MNQPSDKKKILVTGAFGFVGTNLIEDLRVNYEILALDVKSSDSTLTCYSWQELDAIPWDELHAIIHLAGKAHDTRNTSEEKEYFDVNYGLTSIIVDRVKLLKDCKLIYFSSVKAVADTVPEGQWLTEDTLPNPKTPYGKSKLAAEQLLLHTTFNNHNNHNSYNNHNHYNHYNSYNNHNNHNPYNFFLLRPAMIHGPGNKGNLNELVRFVKTGIPWPLGAFENQRSFTSISNLSYVVEMIVRGDVQPGIYQVADDETLSTNELIRMIAEAMGKRTRILKISPGLIRGIARLGDLIHLPLNSERLHKLSESYRVSNQKLKDALGIDLLPVTAAEGMTDTLKTF
jgi:nucleoside-diphosphate-sugar epimerase